MLHADQNIWHETRPESGEQQYALLRVQAEILEQVRDAIFVRDVSSGAIVYWNRGAEELYGYSKEEAVGTVSHELLQTEFPEPLADIETTMLQSGQWEGELVHRTHDGGLITVESRWTVHRNSEGEPVAFLETNHDVTRRKQAEAALAGRVEELGLRNREVAAIDASFAAISQDLDLSAVLENIVGAARELIQAKYAALGVADWRGRITAFITSGITPEQRAAIGPLPQGHGLLGALIRDATPLRVRNIAEDPRSHGFPPNHPPMTSLLGVPILFQSRVVGNLYLTDKIGADEFSEHDQELLTILAGQAAIVIENARLYDEVRAARDQFKAWNRDLEATVAERTREVERISRELTARVLQAQEEERGRIARELHDETAQSLSRLLIDLDLVKPHIEEDGAVSAVVGRLEQGLQRTLDEVRSLSHDLRPAILEDFGLGAAIQMYADDWQETFRLPLRVDIQPDPEDRLPSDMEIALFRIAQEALMNAGKYSRARQVHLSLSYTPAEVELEVRDDGAGFDQDGLGSPTRQGGFGLYGMQQRALLLEGRLIVDSAPGKGTRVMLLAPLP